MRRVDADHASDAADVAQRHLPDDEAAPVVADEDCLVDLEMGEQADQIAGQMLDVVGFYGLRTVGLALAALIRRNHPDAGLTERLDLVPPRKRDLRPAMAEDDRRRIRLRTRFVIAHANPVGLGELQRRHFHHNRILFYSAAPLISAAGGAKAACSAANSPGSMSQSTWTWGMMLAPAMKPKSSWSR